MMFQFQKLSFIFIALALPLSINAEGEVKSLPVSFTTSSVSDAEIQATKAQDGEQPAQPLNIEIGPSRLTLFGYAQTKYELSRENHKTKNELDITRIILMANAQITKQLSFFLMLDPATKDSKKLLHEYYGQYEFLPELKLRIGQYKQPFTLENIISPTLLGAVNLNECTLYEEGIAGDPLQGNVVGRDMGIMFTGNVLPASDGHRYFNYSLGVFNGAGINQKENNSQKDVIGMLNFLPTKDITLSTSFILGTGHALTNDIYGRIKAGDNYSRRRWSIGTEIKLNPLMLRSEYIRGWNKGQKSQGWYAEAWLRVLPKLDVVLDYCYLDKNMSLNRDQQATFASFTETNNYIIGLQYWLYKKCRISTQYIFFDRRTGMDSRTWLTQFQIGF